VKTKTPALQYFIEWLVAEGGTSAPG
jgi:hypothetical protein